MHRFNCVLAISLSSRYFLNGQVQYHIILGYLFLQSGFEVSAKARIFPLLQPVFSLPHRISLTIPEYRYCTVNTTAPCTCIIAAPALYLHASHTVLVLEYPAGVKRPMRTWACKDSFPLLSLFILSHSLGSRQILTGQVIPVPSSPTTLLLVPSHPTSSARKDRTLFSPSRLFK